MDLEKRMKVEVFERDYSKAGWYGRRVKPDPDQTFEPYIEIIWVEYVYGKEGNQHCAWWCPIPKGRYAEGKDDFTWFGPVLGDFESLEPLDFLKGPIVEIEEKEQ